MARVECFFQPGRGKIEPPRTIVAFCTDEALPGVSRSLDKLAESRDWVMTSRTAPDDEIDHPKGPAPLAADTGSVVSPEEYHRLQLELGGGA